MTSYRSKNSFRRTATPQSARGAGSSSTQQPILQGKLPAVDLSKKSIASSKRRFSLKSVPSFRTRNNKALEKEDLQQSKATFASHILQVQDLLQECKKFARATKEHKLLAHVSQATERLSKDHDYIIDKVYRNIDELGKVKNERQHTDRQLELLQTKIRNLNFEKWTDQVALQESITALESDIKIINSNGPLMELPEYEYSLHPVANLVFQKFRRLEEVVFLLKKKVAMQRPIASVNDGGVVVVDRSLESIEVDNNDLKKRNRKLVALVKKLRNRLGSAADNLNLTANSAFNFTSRSLITTAGSTDSGDGGNGSIGAGPIKLEPEVYMFTSKYNRMLAALFSDYSNGIPIPPTGVVNFDEIRKFNANINIVQMLVLAKSFNIVPALITRETFEDIFRECNRQSQDVLDEHIDTMTFAQFKEFFARVALTNTRSFPGQTPSQLDQVKLMLYNIDMIAQDKIYRWQERQNHNPQGVMAHLARYDDQFRAMYCGYAKLRSAVGRLMEGQDTKIHVDVKLRMNYSEFLELASDFGLFPDLLTQVQLREVFQKCAVSDVETRAQNARHLTYPDFKMAFTHLSVKANSYFPSLDSHSLFEQGFDSNLTVLSDFLNYLQITDVDAVSMTQRVATYKAQDNSPLETVNKYILNGNQNSDSTRSSNAIAAKRPATGSDTNPFQKEASAESWVTVLRPFEQTLKDIFVFYGHTQLSDLPQLMDQKDIGLGFDQHIGSVVNGDASGSAVSINFSSANPLSHDSVEEEGAETSGSAADTSDEVLTSTRFNLHELIMFCDDFFLTPCLIEKEIIEHAFISCGRNVKSNTVGGSSSAPNSFALKTGTLTFREFKECLARLAPCPCRY